MTHIHAEQMKQYAEDALTMDEPWLNWQQAPLDGPCKDAWQKQLKTHPGWDPDMKYRRVPTYLETQLAKYKRERRITLANQYTEFGRDLFTRHENPEKLWCFKPVNTKMWYECTKYPDFSDPEFIFEKKANIPPTEQWIENNQRKSNYELRDPSIELGDIVECTVDGVRQVRMFSNWSNGNFVFPYAEKEPNCTKLCMDIELLYKRSELPIDGELCVFGDHGDTQYEILAKFDRLKLTPNELRFMRQHSDNEYPVCVRFSEYVPE